MRVSIVIACLNAAPVIERCLETVVAQDYPDIEVVVADGGSRDGTQGILGEAGLGRPLIWISEPDLGIADAWNKAVARATGEWLLFLGPDDTLAASDVISRAMAILRHAAPRHRVVYGQIAMISPAGRTMKILDRPWSAKAFRGCRYNLPHQAVFHHRSLFAERGQFDTSYSIVADFDFLLRELMSADPLYIPDLLVCCKRAGGVSNSGRYAPQGVLEQIRLFRLHVGGAAPTLYWCLFKACIKYALYALGGDSLVARMTGGGQHGPGQSHRWSGPPNAEIANGVVRRTRPISPSSS